MDVVKPSGNAAIVELARKRFGSVDVIFLNAGLMPSSPLSAFVGQKSGHIITKSSSAAI